jgi:hypothetical protein
MSWSPAGHRAIAAGEKARAEEGDDRRGRAVSESERERARAGASRVARPARAAGSHERVGGPRVGWAELKEKRRSGPIGSFVFLFQKCE